MIAYNRTSLDNLSINEAVVTAFDQQLISKEDTGAIIKAYPVNMYMPNVFIRIGLFLLTTVIVVMVYGFLLMAEIGGSEKGLGVLTFIFSLVLYGALEFIIREKKHYRSGIDDALLWLCIIALIAAANLVFSGITGLANAVLVFIPAFYFLLRFGNAVMGALAFAALLTIIFYSITPLGNIPKTIMPFLLMAIAFFVYWLAIKFSTDNRVRYYKHCCTLIEILALIILYAAGNFFVVREVSNSLFDLQLQEGESVPFGWIFWIPTVLFPAVYIFRGIQKRDVILLRTGLILVAAIIFTIRYYYHVAPIEIAMSIGGAIMILLAYFITKYLTPAKHGFTHAEPNDPGLAGLLQVESIIVAQTFHQTPTAEPDKHFDFGGGSGGGAGSTGNY
ncbi:hypothetical protein A4H97_26670 [Niastella yeongjuensis]|uniref:DUF2157 domain-containing protein n=1 Tax=Niastella yeongjuensis TaxID=354355 RepID=A0A1V9F0L7_9BACT|nr:hypothetical protein [Niastella yeongjuensis]OQP51794.1 hypothetical protein A4H97_26670 [Niastella yeongjuensis]SEP44711.1 hypothetical protein SAMN05660816_06241 [Niastella yeongjuensis]